MRTLFHIATTNQWNEANRTGAYTCPSLEAEGFIHGSRPHQVLEVADRVFGNETDLVLLYISEEKIEAPVKYEGCAENLYPHIYGSLNLDAVLEVYSFNKRDGGYSLPDVIKLVGENLIRRGLPGDEAEIASCHTHAWQESYKGLVPQKFLDGRPLFFRQRLAWWKSIVEGENPAVVFVAESAQHGIVAFCTAEPARNENHKGKGEIAAIYCLNEYKRQGLGSALFKEACRYLKGKEFPKVYLWVLKENPSVEFYKRMGGIQMKEEMTIDLGGPLKEIGFEWDLSEVL